MGFFDYFKFKKDEQKAFALQQQVTSLKEEVASEEKKKEELLSQVQTLESQITELNNQVVVQRNELYDLQQVKEKVKKQEKKATEEYERLYKILKSSTRQVRSIPSSEYAPLVSLSDKYLISIDEDDFHELSLYYSIKEGYKSCCEKKEQREKELKEIENRIVKAKKELYEIKTETIKQKDLDLTSETKVVEERLCWQHKQLNEVKSNVENYLRKHKEIIRYEIMHENYQRVLQNEDTTLRDMRQNILNVDIEELRERIKFERYLIKIPDKIWGSVDAYYFGITQEECNLIPLINEFVQLNISKIVKEMKNSDWETIRLKIGSFVGLFNLPLGLSSWFNSDVYTRNLSNFLEAKYIFIQKQELEREKEREEREAQREYELAIKKALKDEEKAQKALEKKKRELAEEQTQEKILKLQEQIQGLEKALVEAQELRERAMSMAQQTKTGYVYIISNIGSFGKDVYKIGMTRRLDPMERVLELSNASVPFPFDVHTFIYSEDAPALEADLHRRFDDRKINTINYRKEYFRVSLDEIKKALQEKGVEATFIDEPDAFQYRESIIKEKQQSLFE